LDFFFFSLNPFYLHLDLHLLHLYTKQQKPPSPSLTRDRPLASVVAAAIQVGLVGEDSVSKFLVSFLLLLLFFFSSASEKPG
jgi:hypothetical protein